jgi:hypothetical protein
MQSQPLPSIGQIRSILTHMIAATAGRAGWWRLSPGNFVVGLINQWLISLLQIIESIADGTLRECRPAPAPRASTSTSAARPAAERSRRENQAGARSRRTAASPPRPRAKPAAVAAEAEPGAPAAPRPPHRPSSARQHRPHAPASPKTARPKPAPWHGAFVTFP